MMQRALVSGVDGFTGRYLAPLLAARGYEVHGLVQHAIEGAIDGVAWIRVADLTDAASVSAAVSDIAPHTVAHLAGISFVADSDAQKMYAVNLLGTRHLLEALVALPSAPRAVLLASSANVYGNATGGVLDESTPPAPASDYAVSKLAMEYLGKLYAARLPVIICRPFNYTGVGQSETFLLPKIAAHVRRKAALIELGNLEVARDFSDVREVSALYARLLELDSAVGRTLNICSGQAHTLREILDMAAELSGRRLEVRVNPALVRSNEVRRLLGSRAALDALLPGALGKIPLRETLRWMIEDRG
jgi:nucleoside-diphosphate-sugar epimerase